MTGERYQVSDSAAATYERDNVPLSFGPWARVLIDRSGIKPGDRVLDVACGTGIVARTAAPLVGVTGHVTGCDLNEGMLAEAAKHVPAEAVIDWHQRDATDLGFDDEGFELVFCQQALQYIPNREAAVAEMCRVLRAGGEAVVSVWRSLDHNPIQRTCRDRISEHLSPQAGSLFNAAFNADLDDVTGWVELFTEAGFAEVTVASTEVVVPADDPRRRLVGPLGGTPIADQIDAMDPSTFEAMVADMLSDLDGYIADGRLEAPTVSNVIVAHK